MINEINISSGECPSTDELFVGIKDKAGRYKLLQLIVNPNDARRLKLGQDYLVITNNWFGIYELENFDYSEGKIQMKLKSNTSDDVTCVTMDTSNQCPMFFLIRWNDIKQMVYEDAVHHIINDELLELETD